MALSALRGRKGRRPRPDAPLEIGSSDSGIINCPVCSRPIVSDARRCPGCRTRLLIGVPLRRAVTFMAIGAVAAMLVGAFAIGAVSAVSQAITAASTARAASAAPAASAALAAAASPATMSSLGAAPADPAVPAASVTALRQALVINGRLASGADALRASLEATPFESFAVASVLRALAADATVGSTAAARLSGWSDSAAAQAALASLYDRVRGTARSGLAAGLANQTAYRSAAKEMLTVLAAVSAIDETTRALASGVGPDLPPAGAP